MSNKRKIVEFVSPKCVSSFPKLTVPGLAFNKRDEVFSVDLIMSPEQAEAIRAQAAPIVKEFIDDDLKASEERAKSEPKTKKTLASKKAAAASDFGISIKDQFGENGEPTGLKMVRFKSNAVAKWKDKSGKEQSRKVIIPLFDAKGKLIPTHDKTGTLLTTAPRIYGGTEMKVSFQVSVNYVAASEAYYASLRITAVQIINLVSGGAVRNAEGYGFTEEEGYEAEEATVAATANTEVTGAEAAANY